MDIAVTRERRRAWIFTILAALSLIVLPIIVIYGTTFRWMVVRFLAPASYFGHGFLVPAISLALVWRARRGLEWGRDTAPWSGTALLLAGAGLHLLATAFRIHFVSGLSLLPVLGGLVLLLGGRRAARRLAFPILYLVFMVPLPLWLVANASLALKLLTAETALSIANAAGMIAIREGATIHFAGDLGSLVVGSVCSGLRYSVALLAFGALMAHFSKAGAAGKGVILLATVPAAVAANVVRVLLLLFVGSTWGASAASGRVHDLSGVLVFVVAFLLLMGAERVMRKLVRR